MCSEWNVPMLAGIRTPYSVDITANPIEWPSTLSLRYPWYPYLCNVPYRPVQLLFWDCSTVKVNSIWFFEMSGTKYPKTQRNPLRGLEFSSKTNKWNLRTLSLTGWEVTLVILVEELKCILEKWIVVMWRGLGYDSAVGFCYTLRQWSTW
jgi:hypothetical protein